MQLLDYYYCVACIIESPSLAYGGVSKTSDKIRHEYNTTESHILCC